MTMTKNKNTKRLATVIRKYDCELEVLKVAGFRIEKYYEEAKVRYATTLGTLTSLEQELRGKAEQHRSLSLTDMYVRRDYLLQQRELVEEQRVEKENIERQQNGIIEKLKQQKIKIQLLEKLRDRRAAAIDEDLEKQVIKELDEMWLLRR